MHISRYTRINIISPVMDHMTVFFTFSYLTYVLSHEEEEEEEEAMKHAYK